MKQYGFYMARRREVRARRSSRRRRGGRCVLPAAGVFLLLLMSGATQAQQRDSAPPLNSSGNPSATWQTLSGKFEATLTQHEKTLRQLGEKLATSEANGQQLTDLCERLSAQNSDLKTFNEQMGARMQQRDEDLAAAYNKIDKQAGKIERQRRAIVRLAAGLAALTLAVAAAVALMITKRLKK
jgi:chromosome segregation ATPase